MANFLLLGFLLIAVSAVTAAPPPLRGSTTVQPQAADNDGLPPQQLDNIIDALIGSGDFGNWANIMSSTDPSMFPLSATLFVAEDSAFSDSRRSASPEPRAVDPALFFYHIVPQRLTFGDLLLFPINSRLPTLLIDKSILVTNNSRSNFTLDGSHLTRPDLFSTTTVSVHGIRDVLDFTIHTEPDQSRNAPPTPPPDEEETSPPLPPQEDPESPISTHASPPASAVVEGVASQASRSDFTSAGILSVLCSVLGLTEILGYRSTGSAR